MQLQQSCYTWIERQSRPHPSSFISLTRLHKHYKGPSSVVLIDRCSSFPSFLCLIMMMMVLLVHDIHSTYSFYHKEGGWKRNTLDGNLKGLSCMCLWQEFCCVHLMFPWQALLFVREENVFHPLSWLRFQRKQKEESSSGQGWVTSTWSKKTSTKDASVHTKRDNWNKKLKSMTTEETVSLSLTSRKMSQS